MKFVSLISSGIDSPVATYLLSKEADEIILIYGDIKPFTDKREVKKFLDIAKYLKKIIDCKIKLYIIPHGENLNIFKQKCNDRFTCVFCKRMLLRYAEKIANKENADAIVMGDNLGQVASQTLHNLKVIDQVVSKPVLRPLIGFDKNEIINIAKKIGTYELSIQKSKSCTAVPYKPATQAKLNVILDEEKKIDIDKLLKYAIKKSKVVK